VVDVERGEIGVGLVGYRFMGRAHSNAYRQVARFFDLELSPGMHAICGRDEAGVKDAAAALGWESYETDYEHTFVHTIKDLLEGIAAGKSPQPSFEDGYRCQAVLDAVERSAESRTWTEPARSDVTAV
jgi:predicted dehydrogenase